MMSQETITSRAVRRHTWGYQYHSSSFVSNLYDVDTCWRILWKVKSILTQTQPSFHGGAATVFDALAQNCHICKSCCPNIALVTTGQKLLRVYRVMKWKCPRCSKMRKSFQALEHVVGFVFLYCQISFTLSLSRFLINLDLKRIQSSSPEFSAGHQVH